DLSWRSSLSQCVSLETVPPLGPPFSRATSDHRGPRAVKSRIWTSQTKAGAPDWRGEDVRPVLPHRPWRRELRRALDTADHPQPVPRLRKLQRDPGGRARALPYPALAAPPAARTARGRRVGAQARGARTPLRAHALGPRPLLGLPVARRVGCALARNRPRESRPLRRAVVDVQRAPPGPAPGSARRRPLRLHRPPAA